MSFSSETKAAAAKLPKHNDECLAMLYGMLIFASVFERDKVVLRTETAEVSDIFCGLLLGVFDIDSAPEIKRNGIGTSYSVTVSDADALNRICSAFSPESREMIDRSIVSSEKQKKAFARGAFLSCGYINSPDKPYRLEFSVCSADLAVDLAVLLAEIAGVMPKLSVRKAKQIVYFRESGTIVDFLNLLGNSTAAFAIMNSQIEREIRNDVNRKNNFDIANLSKTGKTSAEQQKAIKALMENGKFDKLPVSLRTTAKLRLEYPDFSLEQIGEMENPPISKSQVSKRLSRIVEEYKNKV